MILSICQGCSPFNDPPVGGFGWLLRLLGRGGLVASVVRLMFAFGVIWIPPTSR